MCIRDSCIDSHTQPIPAVLEIPSKDHPYDPTKDSILRRARVSFSVKLYMNKYNVNVSKHDNMKALSFNGNIIYDL